MAIRQLSIFILFSLLFLSLSLLCLASTERDLCVKNCHEDEGGLLECTTRCERDLDPETNTEDPRQAYKLCKKRCELRERDPRSQQKCRSYCREELEKRREEATSPRSSRWREKEEARENPYHFRSRSFRSSYRSSNGNWRVLPKFTERSPLFRGIENYRFAFLEAAPRTFVVPHHTDAELLLFFVRGYGTVTFVLQNGTETYDVQRGHVVRVPAGTTIYLSNQNENERLQVAKLYRPVSTPGKFEEYFIAGGENEESYFSGLSRAVLEASFNTRWEQLEKLFGRGGKWQKKALIRKASPEQLSALSQHATSPGKTRKGSRWAPFDIRSNGPTYSNEYGQLFEARPNDFEQLRDVEVYASFANITKGTIMAPHYNTKATTFVFAVKGRAHFEMSCPHLPSRERQGWEAEEEEEDPERSRGRHGWEAEEEEEEEKHIGRYQKIRAEVADGDLFVIPPGHPVAIIAEEEFQAIGFGVNALNNKRNFLAGQVNIIREVPNVAKELTFGVKAEVVDQVFRSNPSESFFVPSRREHGHHDHRSSDELRAFQSILDIAGF